MGIREEDAVLRYADEHKEELFDVLSRLVKINTENYGTHCNEAEGQAFIREWCERKGFEYEIYCPDSVEGIKNHPEYLAGRGTDKRPNLTCTYKKGKGLMLAAHMDTVLIGERSAWSVDPLGGTVKDGKLFGRGAGDDKCGIAVSMFAFQALQDLGIQIDKPLAFTSYVDEEDGGGDGALATCLKYPAETYVNLDGGNYEIWTAGLGGCVYNLKLSLGHPTDNAATVFDGLYIVKEGLKEFAAARRRELHENPLYRGTDMEGSAFRFIGMQVGKGHVGAGSGELSFVIYTDKSQKEVEAQLSAALENVREILEKKDLHLADFVRTSRFFHYAPSKDTYGAIAELHRAAEQVSGKKVRQTGACLSDLSVFLAAGSESSFNFGIFRDFSVYGGAHQADEYVECEQLLWEAKALLLFIVRHCRGTGAA